MARTDNRVAGIVIRGEQVLLMHRVNKGEEYWVFPGGGQEEGETPEETAMREIEEETTVRAKVGKLVYRISWDTGDENYYFLCEYLSGEPKLPTDSIEYQQMQDGDQVYEPLWVNISEVPKLKVYQLEIRDLFIEDYKNGFSEPMKHLSIKLSERRQK